MDQPLPAAKPESQALSLHWPVLLAIAAGVVVGFMVQGELHGNASAYAKQVGIPRFIVQFALVFGPAVLAAPFAALMRIKSLAVQVPAAFLIACLLAGYIGLALEFIAWFIGWN